MEKKRVVIIGAGFAGLAAAKALRYAHADVVLLDRRNYHLFQPLLYQVATAALSPAQIAQPIRAILRRYQNCSTVLAEVTGIDTQRQVVKGEKGELPYDYLIVATGATHTYFGNDAWAKVAPGLKSIEDATAIRQKVLSAFERAEISEDEEERQALMTFVVVGGGPTGVEMAGAIAELAKNAMRYDFRKIDPHKTRVLLVEGGAHILNAFPEKLSRRAVKDLEALGVEVKTGVSVSNCTADGAQVGDTFIAAKTMIWGAGVKASAAATWLGAEHDRAGRVLVQPDLSLPAHENVFVVGDTAAVQDSNGKWVPGLAPAAMQQGQYVARLIERRIDGDMKPATPFKYRNYGTMATIGRGAAVADFGKMTCTGFLAWILWGMIHLMPLVGFRNRFVVACDWMWAYLTYERGVRLITVSKEHHGEL